MCTRQSWVLVVVVVGIPLLAGSCQRNVAVPVAPTVVVPSAPVAVAGAGGAGAPAKPVAAASSGSRVVVQLTEQGFVPDHIPAEVGKPLTLVVTRKTEKTCAHEILFKGQPGKTDLPLNKEVEVTFTPRSSGSVPFGCAMGMMVGGVLEVR